MAPGLTALAQLPFLTWLPTRRANRSCLVGETGHGDPKKLGLAGAHPGQEQVRLLLLQEVKGLGRGLGARLLQDEGGSVRLARTSNAAAALAFISLKTLAAVSGCS